MLIKFSISVIFILADYDTFPFYRARSKHLGSWEKLAKQLRNLVLVVMVVVVPRGEKITPIYCTRD